MVSCPSAGWREVYAWCGVQVPDVRDAEDVLEEDTIHE